MSPNAGRLTVEFNLDVPLALSGPDPDFQVAAQLAALDFRPELKRVTVPTLVLAARHDRVALPRDTLQYKSYLPQATFVMLEQSGHNFFLEENDRMLAVMREFMGRRVTP